MLQYKWPGLYIYNIWHAFILSFLITREYCWLPSPLIVYWSQQLEFQWGTSWENCHTKVFTAWVHKCLICLKCLTSYYTCTCKCAWRRFLIGNTNDGLIDCHRLQAISHSFLVLHMGFFFLHPMYSGNVALCDLIKKTFWSVQLTQWWDGLYAK